MNTNRKAIYESSHDGLRAFREIIDYRVLGVH